MEINVNFDLDIIDSQLMEAIKNNDDLLIQKLIELID